MSDDAEIILEILYEILGKEKRHYESRGQISFNCVECDDDGNKGNLEINYFSHVWKCWSCCDVNDTHGTLGKLIDRYGTKKQKKLYNLTQPKEDKPQQQKRPKLKLPEGYTKFKDSSLVYPVRRQAMNYLKSRGITEDVIEKYQIGFCDKGDHTGRIIIPSYNLKNELNYFISRTWDLRSKVKYKNPQEEKDKIIFWENLIDWNNDVFLVEGAFDGLFLKNSIPMLGKHMSELLFETIYTKVKGNVIICLDSDAWQNSIKLYHELNGGELWGKVKLIKLPDDKDIADLRGEIKEEYYYDIK